jgi:hypothetical protein
MTSLSANSPRTAERQQILQNLDALAMTLKATSPEDAQVFGTELLNHSLALQDILACVESPKKPMQGQKCVHTKETELVFIPDHAWN